MDTDFRIAFVHTRGVRRKLTLVRVCGTLLMPNRTAEQIRTGHGLMSAPTPGSAHGSPPPGYYPDPSIPGYIRYWNGDAWVPGTSRPAPEEGQDLPAPPPGVAVAAAPRPVPVPPPAPARKETGPADRHGAAADGGTGAVVPEPRPHGEADVQSATGPDRKDPRRLHGSRPESASAWGATLTTPGSTSGEDPRIAVAGPRSGDGGEKPRDGAPTGGRGSSPGTVDPGTGGPDGPSHDGSGEGGTLTLRAGGASHSAPDGRDDAPGTSPVRPGAGTARTPQAEGVPPQRDGHPAEGDDMTMTFGAPGATAGTGAGPGGGTPALGDADRSDATMVMRSQAPDTGQTAPSGSSPAPGAGSAPGSPSAQAPASDRPGPPAPVTRGPGAGQPSWARQAHPLSPAESASPAQEPSASASAPLPPWRPPVDDPFLQAARAQGSVRPATLGRRVVARLIDTVVIGALVAGAAVPLGAKAAEHIEGKIDAAKLSGETVTVWLLDGTTAGYLGITLGVLLLVGVVYEVLPHAKWGRTLGKRVCRLEVLDIESHDMPAIGAALRRWLLFGVLGILGVGLLNVVWCVFDKPWRQCWHDKVAHTFVAGSGDR